MGAGGFVVPGGAVWKKVCSAIDCGGKCTIRRAGRPGISRSSSGGSPGVIFRFQRSMRSASRSSGRTTGVPGRSVVNRLVAWSEIQTGRIAPGSVITRSGVVRMGPAAAALTPCVTELAKVPVVPGLEVGPGAGRLRRVAICPSSSRSRWIGLRVAAAVGRESGPMASAYLHCARVILIIINL